MTIETIKIPDLGGANEVEVIEICVAVGDTIAEEDALLVLESDKASMEIPAPKAGVVRAIQLKVGDSVALGDAILELDVGDAVASVSEAAPVADVAVAAAPVVETPVTANADVSTSVETVCVPDVGSDSVEVIELCIAVGDDIAEGDSLVVLESDKASMEVPSPYSGTILAISMAVGDQAHQGVPIVEMQVAKAAAAPVPAPESAAPVAAPALAEPASPVVTAASAEPAVQNSAGDIYAGPAVRKLAREFGIDLVKVKASGPRGRLIKDDLQRYVKDLAAAKTNVAQVGAGLPALPKVDHSLFGEVRVEPRSKMEKLTANNLHASWVNLPHVTQFDEVDISDLDDFRAGLKAEAESRGVKMTPLPFILKAVAAALRANPKFNASISSDGQSTVFKNYVHIGIAVDTPVGLLVPVLRDVDKKSLWELAEESAELAAKAKARKLKPGEMQGGCFTISSLGNIGGTGFTPIINAPELAILGVSKMAIKPQWNGIEFLPAKMLPLSLSYDHRAINGADAGKFFGFLNTALSDVRRLVL